VSIQWKLREGKRLTKQEISHMGSCDSCSLAYREYGYLNSGLGVKSFWSEEEKPKEERDIQRELEDIMSE